MHKIKNLLLIGWLLSPFVMFAQKISTSKFGDISYNMSQKQVAAFSPTKLATYDVNNPELPEEYVAINGVHYHITYYKNMKSKQFEVYMVSSTSDKLSTLSGIKVGSTLDDLWNNYKKYDISIQQVEVDDETKSNRMFTINDTDNGCNLGFYLKNNKIVKIVLSNESGYLNNNVYEN
jgi:hypothetical protein